MRANTTTGERLPTAEIALLWLAVAIAIAFVDWARLDETFRSTDNLMRLVQVRNLLDGTPWFDPHEPRFAPPAGYDTHWSRLLDAGLGAMMALARQVVSPDLAERLVRCIWPLLLAGPTVAAAVAIAARLGGVGAGRATLVSAFTTLALLSLHRPGEIDHHNAQVMLSLVLVACALWCERPRMAAAAGVAGGLLLSIGLEAAHVPIAVTAAFGLLAARDPAWHRPARDFSLALGSTTLAGYLALTPSALRFAPQCDALAINSALAVAAGAGGLAAMTIFGRSWTRLGRLLALGMAGLAALAVFAAFEPRCLKGPFGLIDRSIFKLWLDQVEEMQGLGSLFRTMGPEALVYVGFPAVAALAIALVVRQGLRTPLAWALIAAFAISVAIMVGQIRIIVYAIWLGVPFVGVAAQCLAERTSRVLVVRVAAAFLASPPVVAVAISSAVSLVVGPSSYAAARQALDDKFMACFQPGTYRTLATLPGGLVMGPLDLGPSVLAHTPHSVVAAPYHRADRAIRFNQEVMKGPRAAARQRVIDRGVDYVITCTAYPTEARSDSFHDALLADAAGPWLEPVPTPDGTALKIWQVVR